MAPSTSPTTPPTQPPTPSTITKPTLTALLTRYDALITDLSTSSTATPNLQTLDHLRYTSIPARLAARRETAKANANANVLDSGSNSDGQGAVCLEKAEVLDLVRWKLRHGTFRPRLTQLVASNTSSAVREVTGRAFALYDASLPSSLPSSPSRHSLSPNQENDSTYLPALKTLTQLNGIGPATASLLLAVYDPVRVPFFADELFWWMCCGGEWGVGIRYVLGEYGALWVGVGGVRGRLGGEGRGEGEGIGDGDGDGVGDGVGAVELERAAWVLGWEARGSGKGKKGWVEGRGKEVSTKGTTTTTKAKRGGVVAKEPQAGEVGPGPDDDKAPDIVDDLTPSSRQNPNASHNILPIPTPTSAPKPERPISPPPKRQPARSSTSKTTDHSTDGHLLRRSKRIELA